MRRLALVGPLVLGVGLCAQGPPRLLADLDPTPVGLRSSEPGSFARAGAWTYFTADDGVRGRELYRTAGTLRTTGLVADVRPGSDGSDPSD